LTDYSKRVISVQKQVIKVFQYTSDPFMSVSADSQ